MKKKSPKQAATYIVEKLQKCGYTALFAGGWVRDYLLGEEGDDIDIATSAHPEEVKRLFPRSVAVGEAFGVILVLYQNYTFEVATFRSDDQYIDGRRPSSIQLHSCPEEDAKRRDFTINGMFLDPVTNTLYDYVGGIRDLQTKTLRTIGDPVDRFREDRLRIVRAIRFKNTFHLSPDVATWNALSLEAEQLIHSVSPERLWQELSKMLAKKILHPCLEDMCSIGLLPLLFPCIKTFSPEYLKERLSYIAAYKHDSLCAVLCCLIPAEYRKETAAQYRLSNEEKTIMEIFTKVETSFASRLNAASWAKLCALPHINIVLQAYAVTKKNPYAFLRRCMEQQTALRYWIVQAQKKKYRISGEDLKAQGIAPGKKMGELIDQAFCISCNHKVKNKKTLLSLLFKDSI